MRSSSEILNSAIAAAAKTLQSVANLEPQITSVAELISNCLTSGGKVLACGNGGSAADAADFCTELACRFVEDRR
ncbi:MAG TPA: SIS domain-containing protein, partial [Pyrinomonadaceae bacterium]